MKNIHIILRTCSNSALQNNVVHQGYTRICGNDRNIMVKKCLMSLVIAINNSSYDIKLTILDDHSDESFLSDLQNILKQCKANINIVHLEEKGFNNSAYKQFLLASESDDLVYTVEDDYLHDPDAINSMVISYDFLSNLYRDNIMIFPFDCPFRYDLQKLEPTVLLHDGMRYWRHVKHTTYTFLTHAQNIKKHFPVFKMLALQYPQVTEGDTINNLYKGVQTKNDEDILVFSPIPSLAYHLSYADPTEIKTNKLSWRSIWNMYNDFNVSDDTMTHFYQNIQGWFDFQELYKDVVKSMPSGSKFVEIGTWKGASTAFLGVEIFNSRKHITIDAIDSFEGSLEHGDIQNFYEETKQNLKPLIDRGVIKLIQGYSHDVVSQYDDNSIDFLFLDASHEYEDVKRDIELWLPKVKSGGIFAGHDYDPHWLGVVKAVNEVLGKENILNKNSAFIYFKP